MKLDPGWLTRQLELAAEEYGKWPAWMREAAERVETEKATGEI